MNAPQTIRTGRAPEPKGAFAQARRAGNLLFIAGQRGIDPATGELVEPSVEARARRALENLKAIAEDAGGSMATFLSTVVYVIDIKAHRPVVNRLFEEYFGPHLPARTIVEVRALNQDDLVEIGAVVLLPEESEGTSRKVDHIDVIPQGLWPRLRGFAIGLFYVLGPLAAIYLIYLLISMS